MSRKEGGYGLAFDAQGNLYLAGGSQAPATPDLNPFQQTTAFINSPVVFKMTPDGRKILYYAFVGNGGWDQALGIGVDATGAAVITGDTRNPNLPLKNAFQTQFKAVYGNAFVSKLSPDGKSLVYSSFYGGSNYEDATGIALDSQGNAYVVGQTHSSDIPVKQGSQSRYAGGGDGYAAKVGPDGTLLWSTYIGGSLGDSCNGIAVDAKGNAYIAASSNSTDFPLKNAIQTGITPRAGFQTPVVIKLRSDGSISAATFIRGPTASYALAVALDSVGNVYFAGGGDGAFVTKNAFQPHGASDGNGFIWEMDPELQNISFATYFSGSQGGDFIRHIAVDGFGSLYVTGSTTSADMPLKGSFQSSSAAACASATFSSRSSRPARSL